MIRPHGEMSGFTRLKSDCCLLSSKLPVTNVWQDYATNHCSFVPRVLVAGVWPGVFDRAHPFNMEDDALLTTSYRSAIPQTSWLGPARHDDNVCDSVCDNVCDNVQWPRHSGGCQQCDTFTLLLSLIPTATYMATCRGLPLVALPRLLSWI